MATQTGSSYFTGTSTNAGDACVFPSPQSAVELGEIGGTNGVSYNLPDTHEPNTWFPVAKGTSKIIRAGNKRGITTVNVRSTVADSAGTYSVLSVFGSPSV